MRASPRFFFPVSAAILRIRTRAKSRVAPGLCALLSGAARDPAARAERSAREAAEDELRKCRAALRRAEATISGQEAAIAALTGRLETARSLYAQPREVDRRSEALMAQIAAQRSAAEIPPARERSRLARETRRGKRLEGGLR